MRFSPFIVATAAAALAAIQTAAADEIMCAEIQLDSYITSTGEIGVLMPGPIDEEPVRQIVQPGECFYDGALQAMRSTCAALGETVSPTEPGDYPSIGLPVPDVAASPAELRARVSQLRKRVRTLRQRLHRLSR